MRWGEIAYARAGDHHIAYREVVGDDGDQEIVVVTGAFWPMESFTDAPPGVDRLVPGLAALGRVVLFDRRGVALSDPVTDWDTSLLEQWADDLAAVIQAAGCDRPTVFSWNSSPIARLCAIRHPELIGRLVLFNPSSEVTDGDSTWVRRWIHGMQRMRAGASQGANEQAMPARSRDPAFRAWNDAAGRAGASPSQAGRLDRKALTDPFPDQREVRVPTLVLTRTPPGYVVPAEFFARAAHAIPGAELVVLPPGDATAVGVGVDDLLAEISRFLTGRARVPAPERRLAAILFTDLVGSTRRAADSGDAEWKRLLDRHDAACTGAVTRRGGEVVKTTGDGILALLPSTSAAIEAAAAIRAGLADDDLEVRVGIHVGEIDRRGDDVSGLAVNIAARIMSIAGAGQILCSAVAAQTTDAVTFTSLGARTLKDVEGSWELLAAD